MANKETNPMVKRMIDYFHDWYARTHGFNFTWSPKEAAQMKNLYNCIATFLQGQGKDNGAPEVFVLYERMLLLLENVKAAKWYLDHAAPSNFVSKFNDIISVIMAEYQKTQARTQMENLFDE